jgi:hypothetical protein
MQDTSIIQANRKGAIILFSHAMSSIGMLIWFLALGRDFELDEAKREITKVF